MYKLGTTVIGKCITTEMEINSVYMYVCWGVFI